MYARRPRARSAARCRVAFLALCGTLVATAAVAAPLTLADALARAAQASPAIRAAAAEVEAARGRALQAGLFSANPVVSGDAADHRSPSEQMVDRGVSLGQEIEVGGQRGLRVSAARYDVARVQGLLADQRRLVAGEVRRAFAGALAAERRQDLALEIAALAARLLETASHRLQAGDAGAIDQQLARVESVRAARALTTAEMARADALARLARALGADPEEAIEPVVEREASMEAAPSQPPPPPALPAAEEDALVERALAARPDLAAARAERAQRAAEADLTHRRGSVPNPVVRAFYREELADERIAGGELSLPLPLWNREQGTEIAQRAAVSAGAVEVERLQREIAREVHLALVRRATATAAWMRYQRDALPAARTAMELLERGYTSGYLGLADTLMRRDQALQARDAAIGAWLDLREAEADLLAALGEEDVGAGAATGAVEAAEGSTPAAGAPGANR